MHPRITVLGAGRMGSALASAFLRQKYQTTVWNRTSSRLDPLVALGAQAASSPADAVAAADIVLVNVIDYAVADGILKSERVAEALRGKLLVQLTSGSPRQARDTAAWAAKQGIRYLDGAIMATPDLVGSDHCTILYTGDPRAYDEHKSALQVLGVNSAHVGADVGHAAALDSALLIVMWGALFGTLQGVAVCQAEGLNLAAYSGYLAPFLQSMNGWALDVVKRVEEGRLSADSETVATIEVHHVAFRCLLELCKDRHIHRALPEAMQTIFDTSVRAGLAQEDFAAMSRFLR